MKLSPKYFLIAPFLILAAFFVFRPGRPAPPVTESLQALVVYQTIQGGAAEEVTARPSESALDILRRTQTVSIKETSLGPLVESINGEVNGTNGKYWLYFVNGKEATVGAAQYYPKGGDSIVWKFQGYGQ